MNPIETQGLWKYYGQKAAVQDLNLSVKEGEIYGFLGENGAGKSTTIRMILGLIWPDEGTVLLHGQPVITGSGKSLQGVGAMLDSPYFYPHLSCIQNLHLFASLSGSVTDSQVNQALDRLGMGEMRNKPFGTLSHGQKQRLGIAQALLPDNRLVILDEPQNGLDPLWVRNMRELLSSLSAEGITIFISSHRLHEIELICDRVGIIHQGQLVYEGAVAPLLVASEQVFLRVGDIESAIQLLTQQGQQYHLSENNGLMVQVGTESETAIVVRILVESGIAVYEVTPHKLVLEDVFLSLTGTEVEVAEQGLVPQTSIEELAP
jgi:ABC-2 type transport system ATP-binding protein